MNSDIGSGNIGAGGGGNNEDNGKKPDDGKVKAQDHDTKNPQFGMRPVRTKVEDGGSNQEADSTTQTGRRDSFREYSNQNARMNHLLGLQVENPQVDEHWRQITGFQAHNGEGAQAQANANNLTATERQSRLSTELHYSVFHTQLEGNRDDKLQD